MGKFKFSNLLHPAPKSTTTDEKDYKKRNRRSFSPFASAKTNSNSDAPKSSNMNGTAGAEEKTGTSHMKMLADKISSETAKLEEYMCENNLSMPGLTVDSVTDFPKLPKDMQESRMAIIHASAELESLVKGPKEMVRWMVWDFLDVLALQVLNNYGIPLLVPKEGTISLSDLQTKTTLDKINLARLLRFAMTKGLFREPEPGQICHSAASLALMEDQALAAWVGFNTEDIFPAGANVLKALKTYPEATSLVRTGFQFAFNTVDQEPMFVTFGKDPLRAKRMGGAMASLTGGEGYEVFRLVDGGYDFSDVDARGGTLVDVGGSHGFVCVDLAKKYKNMKFIVQDLPKTVDSAPRPISDDVQVAERIELMPHDFFTEQKVKDADVYFFRWIIHNYSTPYAVKILKNLVPALKPGARILINDHCLREPGSETPWDDRIMRGMDLIMMTLLNAQERDENEFRELFAAADEGYVFKGVKRQEGCRMVVVEAVWQPGLVKVGEGPVEEKEEERTEYKEDKNEEKEKPSDDKEEEVPESEPIMESVPAKSEATEALVKKETMEIKEDK